MAYTKTTWVNGVTQRNAANFNHMEDGIEANDIAIGKVAVDIADAYSTAKTYAVGDYCINANTLYKCNTDIIVPEAWTASHWTATTIEAELNAKIATVNDTIDDMKDTTLSGSLANQISTLNNNLTDTSSYFTPSNNYFDVTLVVKQSAYVFSMSALAIVTHAVPNNAVVELPIQISNCDDINVYTQAFTNTGIAYAVSKNSDQKLQIENYTGAEIPVGAQLKINLTMVK